MPTVAPKPLRLTITEPPRFGVQHAEVNVLCNGASTGSIDLTVTGGTVAYTYMWSNGEHDDAKTLLGLVAGTYTVTVTDANGCTKTTSATITEPTVITLTATPTNSTCGFANGSINLTVSGGVAPYTYVWSNGADDRRLWRPCWLAPTR